MTVSPLEPSAMRKIVILLLALLIAPAVALPTAAFGGPKLKAVKQEHAHKKRMKKAAHKEKKSQKEHKLLHHGKSDE
jgi:hypothetical protein